MVDVIEKNSRQIPKHKKYLTNSLYSDIVYSWLQVNSYWDQEKNIRYIDKKDVKFTKIGEELGVSRQTASQKFKKLLDSELDLITFNEKENRYELNTLNRDLALLIQNNTLRKMVSALNENAISLFVYLYNRYLASQSLGFQFTLKQLKEAIGLSSNTRSNNYIILDILEILGLMGLVEYSLEEVQDEEGYKTIYYMKKMSNKIKNLDARVGREAI